MTNSRPASDTDWSSGPRQGLPLTVPPGTRKLFLRDGLQRIASLSSLQGKGVRSPMQLCNYAPMQLVLGVSGGIAAYKAPDLVRRLQDVGAAVRVILTPNAARFVSPLSLAAVSNHGVILDQWGDAAHGGVDHIELARWAELLLIAPATANIIAKLATGIADDALSTYALAHRGPVMVVPAMNTFMLLHGTVVANLE